jgi:hypothetical protein
MRQINLMEKYPVFVLEVLKSETDFKNADEIAHYLKEKIYAHKIAEFIAVFEHYMHTKNLEEGVIAEGIIDAKNVVFCFGKQLPKPEVLAVRPRSIGICEYEDKFILSFLEAPNAEANDTMKEWIKSVKK